MVSGSLTWGTRPSISRTSNGAASTDRSRDPQSTSLYRLVEAFYDEVKGCWEDRFERLYGHRRGKASVKAIVELSRKIGIEYLSLYAFSSENWQRSPITKEMQSDKIRILIHSISFFLSLVSGFS